MKSMVKRAMTAVAMVAIWPAVAAEWKTEMVDQFGPGTYSSMKIDRDGNAHIAYVVDDGNRFPLKYAFWDRHVKSWFTMTVAYGAGACSLALDTKQRPHISYADAGSGSGARLRHARWDGKSWTVQAIPLNSDVIAYFNSIAVDNQDRPSIAFYEYRGPKDTDIRIRLRTVAWNGQLWEARTVDPEEGSGKFNSMAIDAKGHLHLAYANVSAGTAGLRYGYWNGTKWSTEVVEGLEQNNGAAVGFSTFVALDRDGNPHIAYVNESTPQLRYATRKENRWRTEVVEPLAGIAYPDRNSMVVDEAGLPYIGYFDAGRRLLKIAHREGDKWSVEAVDSDAGFTSSLQINGGELWISYADTTGLKVARRPIPAGGPARKEASSDGK